LNLDVRDFTFWLREAERKVLNEKISDLRLSRMAWADADYVQDELNMYQQALYELSGSMQQKIQSVWEEMKLKGKG
jgi:hypothetical protein